MKTTLMILTIAGYWLNDIFNLEWKIISIPLPNNQTAVIKLTAEIENKSQEI